ncbi:oxoglutarate/iron-dependent dioxygenase [Artemisia annua]|uniref:Oxoglutarate/iron-dependent dioxygenase n=1 Tax=Artemisia annua TaxID=35608 RepID=A0A2U1M361_ARTAN|nr:oxoglutarate/iron-dependent dioxygenase [Artemisia annua]
MITKSQKLHKSLSAMVQVNRKYQCRNRIQDHLEPTFVSYDCSPLTYMPVIDINDLLKKFRSDMEQLKNLHSEEVRKYIHILAEETSRYKLKAGEYEGYGQILLHAQEDSV